MVSLRSRILFRAFGALLLPCALASCGGGGSSQPAAVTPAGNSTPPIGSATPQTADQIIISRYGSSPTQLSYANAVGAASTTLLQANVSDAPSAKQALLKFSASINCTQLSSSEVNPIQTDVMSLIFNTAERRAKLQDTYIKAGAFEIDPETLKGSASC